MPLNSRSKPGNWKKKRVQTTASKNAPRQLEAAVHTSLPPLVEGSLRGHLVVSLEGGIVWEYSVGPPTPKLCVQLKWWGEKSPGTTFRVPVQVGSGSKSQLGDVTSFAYFPIRSALSQLSAYLKDMGSLTFQVGLGHMTDSSMVIGEAVVPSLKQLTPSSPLKGCYPVVNSSGVHLGKLCVHIRMKTATQLKEEPTLKKVTLPPPEFIVGPGACLGERRVTPCNLSNEDSSTMVGGQNKIVSSRRTRRGALKEINIPTGGGGIELKQQNVPEKMEAGLGAQQLEVVSELIERGQELRSKMVESIINQRTDREESTDRKQELDNEGAGLELYGVGIINVSSEEEDELNILSDVSLDESDYPEAALLSALYLDHPTMSGVITPEQEGSGLVSPQAEKKDLQTEDKSTETGETSEQKIVIDVDRENEPSTPGTDEPFKLSSKLTREEQGIADTALPSGGSQRGSVPGAEKISSVGSATSDRSGKSKEKVDSLTSLSSYFVKGQSSLEAAIVSAIGLEKLTQLGRVGSARITVGSLQIEPSFAREILTRQREMKRTGKSGSGIPPPINSTKCPTYFVEYQFPASLHQPSARAGRRKLPVSHELMRIASKKMTDGVVKFNHHSVFLLEFDSTVIHHWWNTALIFRVYCRPPSQRMPFLVGKAVLPLKRILSSKSPCNCHYWLEIKTSTLADAVRERETDDTVVGSLEILLELVQSGKRDPTPRLPRAKELEVVPSVPEYNDEALQPSSGSNVQEEVDSREQTSPIHFKETDINTREVSAKPPALQLLLFIPEAIDVSTLSPPPPTPPPLPVDHKDSHHRLSLPNCYLICKLFCAKPHPQTPVQWASSNPQFGIKQLCPLYLTPALLNQVKNNFTVVEVWHRTPGSNTDDELIGLVKLSLHQFYLAFSDEDSIQLCCQAELPVVAVDSCCPIVNPFSGHMAGHLAVLLALGTATQISRIQQQYASGCYTLQPPHRAPAEVRKTQHHLMSAKLNSRAPSDVVDGFHNEGAVEHVFKLCIEGVRDVSTFASTVWGEADCFVQYHFPTLISDDDEMAGDLDVSLYPYRTGTTLCVPNPSFSHETHHPLLLESGEPVQKYLMAACGGGLGGGVPFELWRRYYYPNIRDQLVARASLPVAKLCALVTMQGPRGAGMSNIQDFALPLKLVADVKGSTDSNGVLDVSLKYQAVQLSGGKSSGDSQHINITVSILRAAGLKDAAAMVAPDNPIALGLAAEVGVNAYATVSLPGILKEKRTTKTIARSFSPEFSHLFDLALPLLTLHSTKHSHSTLAQKLAEGYILVEMWHQAPKRSSPSSLTGAWQSPKAESGVVTGRRLIPGTKDVLLGRAKVPLMLLLQKSTGIHGWFALESPVVAPVSSNSHKSSNEGTDSNSNIAGGVEVSVAFTNEEIRDLVLSSGLRHGWRLPDAGFFPGATPQLQLPLRVGQSSLARKETEKPCFDGKSIKFEINVSHASLRLSAVDIPTTSQPTHKYCFLRYRFFDRKAVVTSPKAITCSREGIATYQLNHRAQLHLTGSAQLQWCLSEENLEVQVWTSLTKTKLGEGPRPLAEDGLLGSAYIPLCDIISRDRSISGCFPLFKAGVDSLGAQSVHVEIHKMVLSDEATPHPDSDTLAPQDSCMEVLDSSDDDDEDISPSRSAAEGKKKSSDGKKEGEMEHEDSDKLTAAEEVKEEEMVQDTFSAHIVIHQALHLPELGSGAGGGEVSPPCPYVTAHPHPNVQRITTATVAGSRAPVWEHQCTTRIPNHYLQPQSQGLEFQVWSRNSSNEEQQQDGYIGSVHIDLCPLTCGLSHICGWYDISDFGGQTRGQLKISIAPTQRISYPSPLLAYSTLVTATSSFRSRDTPLVSIAPLVGGDGPSELSTERLLTNNPGAAGESIDQLSSHTRSMLFQQLRTVDMFSSIMGREDILELDGIHKHLLTKLCPRDSTNPSSQLTSSHPPHQVQPPQKETTILHSSGMELMDEAPPLAPPTLLCTRPSVLEDLYQGSKSHSIVSSPPQHAHLYLDNKSILSEKSLPPPLTQREEEASSAVSQQSLPPPGELSLHSLIEDSERQVSPAEGSPTTLTGSRSGSLTDVSMCSKDSSVIMQSHDIGMQSISWQQMKVETPGKSEENEQLCSNADSTSEHTSTCSNSPQPLEEEVADVDNRETPPTSETLPTSTIDTSTTITNSHHTTTAPLDRVSARPTIPSIPHHTQSLHTSTQEEPPFHSQQNCNKDCPTPSHSGSPSTSSPALPPRPPPPPIPTFRLPNFFMTPQQLEESMRSLRAGALSQTPPRTLSHLYPPPATTTTTTCAQAQCHHTIESSVASHLKTLQEVRAYLESRRTAANISRPQDHAGEISAVETRRLARIFSS